MNYEGRLRLDTARLWITPLALDELERLNCGISDIPLDPDALTDAVRLAIGKKIARMRGVDADHHEWLTYWLIVLRESGQGIGFAGFKGIGADGFAEVGYGMSPNHRQRGYMAEALAALVRWAEANEAVQGVFAKVDPENTGSVMTLKHCGFEISGCSAGQDEYRNQFSR